jgi:hypothetical protein
MLKNIRRHSDHEPGISAPLVSGITYCFSFFRLGPLLLMLLNVSMVVIVVVVMVMMMMFFKIET